jgi:PAS domain S-box-containing protein
LRECMENRVARLMENEFTYPDGSKGWFELSIQPVPEGTLIMSFDITEHIRAEKQVTRLKRLYATLSQVNQTIARVKDREELFQAICDVAVESSGFALVWIGLLDEDAGEIRPVAANGLDVAQWPFPIIDVHKGTLKDGLIARAIRTSKVITSEDIQTDKRLKNLYSQLQKYAYHSSAAVPFRLNGRTIGVLSLVSPEEDLFKAEEEKRLLEEMGLDISFTLDTMKIEAERKRAERKIERQNQRLKVLREIDTTILAADSVENIVEAALSHIRKLIDCRRAGMVLIDWETNEAEIFNVRTAGETSVTKGSRVPLMLFQAMPQAMSKPLANNQPVLIHDLTELPDLPPLLQTLSKEGLRSVCILPLFSQGSQIGTFNLLSETPGFFDDERIGLGREVANQMAIAITQNRLIESLRESEKRFRSLYENATIGMYRTTPDGKILLANPALVKMLGYSSFEELAQRNLEQGGYDPNYERSIFRQQIERDGVVIGLESAWIRKDGGTIFVRESAKAIQDMDGKIIHYEGTVEDITERKRVEKELRVSEAKFRAVFDNAPIGISLLDAERRVLESNEMLEQIVRIDEEGLAARAYRNRKYIREDETEIPTSELASTRAIVENRPVRDIINGIILEDGEVIWTQVSAAPLRLPETRIVVITQDITERKQYEKELQTLNTELEQRVAIRTEELVQTNIELEHANRAKDEFLATMSHELRTPLNSILGLSETLLEQRSGSVNAKQKEFIQTIETSGHHLLELINDVLDLSKIEAGKLDFYPQIVDVDALCKSSLAFVKEQALRKSIDIFLKKDSAGIQIYADPRRLKQILVNLLTNAVKFTLEHGQVKLQVHTNVEDDLVQFSVADNGIGIALEDLQRLFQPFVQVDSSLNRQFEGTGLGLCLVQKLTDLHGGSVQVESEGGVGSRFTINIPWGKDIVAQQETIESDGKLRVGEGTRKAKPTSRETIEQGKVLLAEDNMANVLTIRDYLESCGYQVVVAHDGLEAIEKAEETDPRAILMDIQMPAMDGLEAIRRLRTNPRFKPTPIIALTALAMPGDRERCLDAGADEYMSKPVSLKLLVKTIETMLESGKTRSNP